LTAGALFAGVSGWMLLKGRDEEVARPVLKVGLITVVVSFLIVAISGDWSARVMTTQQPMKMAAAEALYDTKANAPFSLFTIGTLDGSKSVFQIGLPSVLSFMSTGNTAGTVEGINDLQAQYEKKYGAGNYKPTIWIAYWGFRLMIGFGALAFLIALVALWHLRKGGLPNKKWMLRAMTWLPVFPIVGISFGWIFTESARQPWVVFGLMKTHDGVSAGVSAGAVLFTMITFTVLYGILAVIEFGLFMKTIKVGTDMSVGETTSDKTLTMSY
jgi:cytochrome d ubiquinol oxidase subunit I